MKYLQKFAREIERLVNTEEHFASWFLKSILGITTRFGFTYDDAEEIAYEVLSTLCIKLQNQEFRGESSLKTFAYRISTNICIKHLRCSTCLKRGGNVVHVPIDEHVANTLKADSLCCNPQQALEQQEIVEIVRQGIDGLGNEEYRGVFTLLIEGYGRKEISNILHIPLKRIDAMINYGKKKLAKCVQKKFNEGLSSIIPDRRRNSEFNAITF